MNNNSCTFFYWIGLHGRWFVDEPDSHLIKATQANGTGKISKSKVIPNSMNNCRRIRYISPWGLLNISQKSPVATQEKLHSKSRQE
jgi:hypothetical protein